LLRVASFPAKCFGALESGIAAIRFAGRLDKRAALAVRGTGNRSKRYHTKAVAERVYGKIGAPPAGPSHLDEDDAPPATLLVRIDHDVCTVSLDTSGAHLHKRGYRLATAKAPMRETLAAALLAAADYDGSVPFLDPKCATGTFAIEAGLIACRKSPGIARRFAFERWQAFDEKLWRALRDAARRQERRPPALIAASDRDSGAIEATRANADRAGVPVEVAVQPLSRAAPSKERGLVLANPPYGARMGDASRLRDLYAALGNLARGPFSAWHFGFATTDAQLARAAGEGFDTPHPPMAHGGLKIRLWVRTPD
jgi:putative N6-adenine-specific DNA methylase